MNDPTSGTTEVNPYRMGYEPPVKPVAVYPLAPRGSNTTKLVALSAVALVGIGLLVKQVVVGEPDLRWLFVVLAVVFAAFPAVYWLQLRKPEVGGGDVVLTRKHVAVPMTNGKTVVLPLPGLEVATAVERTTFVVGGVIGGVVGALPVFSSEESMTVAASPFLTLRSAGALVNIQRGRFVDEDSLRQLYEDIRIVSAGGTPDSIAAFMA